MPMPAPASACLPLVAVAEPLKKTGTRPHSHQRTPLKPVLADSVQAVKFVFITWVGASVQSALSETRPRHDTSETRPRHVRDTSETRPRHCTAGVQRRARVVGSRSAGRHGLAGVRRPAAQTLPGHFRDTSVLPPLASTQALGDVAR